MVALDWRTCGGGDRGGRRRTVGRATPGAGSRDNCAARGGDPATAELVARLEASGIDRALAFEIASAIPVRQRRGVKPSVVHAAVAGRLNGLVPADDEVTFARAGGTEGGDATPSPPVHVFVGPPGVGRTTTVAKLAARARTRAGVRVGLISADGHRVGAVEQLRIYADIIGLPFAAVASTVELERELAGGQRPVLVDTAGRAPGDRAARELFACVSTRHDVRVHLVVDAGQATRQIERVFAEYRDARPDRVVLTKLDQIDAVAPVVGMLREHGLPISYLCAGQRVPDDLVATTGSRLAGLVLGEPLERAA